MYSRAKCVPYLPPNMTLTIDDLWNAFRPQERLDGCIAFLREAKPAKRELIAKILARELRFRDKTVMAFKPEDLGRHMAARMRLSALADYRAAVLRAWIIAHNRPLLEKFVGRLGVPHNEGMIDGEVDPPTVQHFQAAIAAVASEPQRIVALYLGYLIAFGDETWKNIPAALEAEQKDISAMLQSDDSFIALTADATEAETTKSPEDNESFTTLDNLLIVTVVASAVRQEGALTQDQTLDMVEEFVDLNSTRHRSLFHRGFAHSLLGKDYSFHFPGENVERRLWYVCGVFFGLLRLNKPEQCIELLDENTDLAEELASSTKVPCGSMLLRHLFFPLLKSSKMQLVVKWMDRQIPRLEPEAAMSLLANAHYEGARLLRRGNAAEADMLFELVEELLPDPANEPPSDGKEERENFAANLLVDNGRKRAQVLQLQGDFDAALLRLGGLRQVPEPAARSGAGILADVGLIKGGFRSIANVLPKAAEEHRQALVDALAKGASEFSEAVSQYGRKATNAHFCLGMLALLQGEASGPVQAADHFSQALSGMLKRQQAYEPSGMIDWTRFAHGIALLESLETANFHHASDNLDQALQSRVVFPLWLWQRAMLAASMFGDKSLAERIAERLLENRGEEVLGAILESSAADGHPELRESVLKMLNSQVFPVRDHWRHLVRLLPGALRDDSQQAERILDSLERLAVDNGEFRDQWAHLLSESSNYSPAWASEDAERSMIRIHELSGAFDQARHFLRQAYYRLREDGGEYALQEAERSLDDLKNLPNPCNDLQSLRESLDQVRDDKSSVDSALRALETGHVVKVLYVGGNETQAQYVDQIRTEIKDEFPGVVIDFDLPGWSSSWSDDLTRVVGKLKHADVVVLNSLVRTQFGRGLRKACGSQSPWIACTGRGKQSLANSIRKASIFAAKRTELQR
jgi:hypothetical protein